MHENEQNPPIPGSFRNMMVDPAKVAFAAAALAAAMTLVGCSTTVRPYSCLDNPTADELSQMQDFQVRSCLEAADRQGNASFSTYHSYYIGRGWSYTPGSYSTATENSPTFKSGSGISGGSSYKSGGGGSFSGGEGGVSGGHGATS